MEKRKRVVIYGNSLHMAGIVASLKVDPSLDVLWLNLDSIDARQSLDENNLTAIVFDLSYPPVPLDITLLRYRPDLLLIGVDPSRDEMLILSSQPARALSIADLIDVIHQKDSNSSQEEGSENNYQ
jgi:hypothetical protein